MQVLDSIDLSQFTHLSFDSRDVNSGTLFFAIRGLLTDGHQFLSAAVQRGAAGLVVETADTVPSGYRGQVWVVPDSRQALGELAARFYGFPGRDLMCFGVTGTNGKTTTSHILEFLLNSLGHPTGVIGTIDHHLGQMVWPTQHTTPDPVSLHRRLREFVDRGAQCLSMEVSSHALAQARVHSVPFRIAIFTNLSRDHLDYHGTMEDYFLAKQKLFSEILPRFPEGPSYAIVNAEDSYGQRICPPSPVVKWTYGQHKGDWKYQIVRQDFSGTELTLSTPYGDVSGFVKLVGGYNLKNMLAAVAAATAAHLVLVNKNSPLQTLQDLLSALRGFAGVQGRLQAVPNARGLHVFVDYAHSDDALRTALGTLRAVRTEAGLRGRIVTVFGCGGDRDKGKRPLMMQAALAGSDHVFLTSDNPRSEDPEAIMKDALAGAKGTDQQKVTSVVDRREAIRMALQTAVTGDVIVIAGKGHETYQQIGSQRVHFSDVEVAEEFLK